MKKTRLFSVISLTLCAVLLLFTINSYGDSIQSVLPTPSPSPGANIPNDPIELEGITFASSYEDILTALNAAGVKYSGILRAWDLVVGEDAEFNSGSAPMATAEAASDSVAGAGYSETNVQVSGVDEGDIVKTDGKYIYILRDNKLIIAEAKGAETAVLSATAVCENKDEKGGGYEYLEELYLYGDYAAVVSYYNNWGEYSNDGDWYYRDTSMTRLYIYDISNPSAPRLLHELGQDGYSLTSRLVDGTLYLLSTYYVYDFDENNESSFVPALYRDGDSELIDAGCIAIWPGIYSTSYTIISAYDMETGALIANQTVLGGGGTVYMNQNNLYLANSTYTSTESEPYIEDGYTVTDYTNGNKTEILRFDISDGSLAAAASGSVPGYLSSQFAMDEYNGYLRMVSTVSTSKWSTYTDEQYGWVNYRWDNDYSSNALYVLDGSLKIVGSVTDLAENEYVYSVRFDGDIGYFVTFRQTDPLFAVDLSDPTNPLVLSALKIPGFSEYLHLFSEGRLFGLGMDADEDTGRTNGMKMTMFDTSDSKDVTEKHTLLLDTDYSTALYNHKAILISAEKDIIAFPTESGYDVYGYSDKSGFYKRAHISTGEWGYDARGLYIGDMVYIVADAGISVFDMASFAGVAYIAF